MNIIKVSGALSAVLLIAAAAACSKGEQAAPEEGAKPEASVEAEATAKVESAIGEGAYVEEHDSGKVAFQVAADGSVKAEVAGPDGVPIREDIGGTLLWNDKPVSLTLDEKTGLLIATGPKLEADLTQIGYTLTVAGKPWSGTLHVPAGGTAELFANAKASAALGLPEGKIGPHGGRIELVGSDRLELVVDEVTGEVRVYLLDVDLKPMAIGERKVTLGVVAEAPQVVVLAPADGGAYLTGKLALAADPIKLTVAMRSAAHTAVALCGYRPGVAFAVGASAPRVKVRVKTDWAAHAHVDPDVKLNVKGDLDPTAHVHAAAKAKADAKAKANVQVKAPSIRVKPPSVNVNVKAEAPKISIPKPSFKASASAGASAKVKLH